MAETFGNTNKKTTEDAFGFNYIRGCKYQSGSAGTLASISVYVKDYYGQQPKLKCAIYKTDLSFLANSITEEHTVAAPQDGWMVFNFITPPSVDASTNYWLCMWGYSEKCYVYEQAGATQQRLLDSQTYDGWPANLTPAQYVDKQWSIYATYYEAPPPAVKTLVQAALISIPPLIVLPTVREILKLTGG